MADLSFIIEAVDRFSSTFNELESRQRAIGDGMQNVGTTMAAAGAAGAAGIGMAVKSSADFEASMNRVAALSGATDSEMQNLTATAKQLGADTAYSAKEASEGMQLLSMAGFDAEATVAAMPAVLDAAAAGQVELAESADITSNVLSGFGMEAEEAGRMADVLTKTFTSSNTSMSDLGQTMQYIAPVASAAGMSLEEMSAATGLLGDAGIQGSKAGTSLRAVITRLSGPTGKAAELMDELGIKTTDSSGKMLPFADILENVESATSGMGEAQKLAAVQTLVGQEAASSFLALMDAGPDTLRNFTGELENAGGTAERIANKQLEGLKGSITELMGTIETAAIAFGTHLLPALEATVDGLKNVINAFTNAPTHIQKFIAIFTSIGTVLTLVTGGLLVFAGQLMKLAPALAAAAKYLKMSQLAVLALGGAVGIAIAAIVALAAAVITYWDEIAAATSATWNAITSVVSSATSQVASALESMGVNMSAVRDRVSAMGDAISNTFRNIVVRIRAAILNAGQTIEKLANYFKIVITEGDYMNDWITHLPAKWRGPIMAIGEVVAGFRDKAVTAFNAIMSVDLGAWASNVWESMKPLVGTFAGIAAGIMTANPLIGMLVGFLVNLATQTNIVSDMIKVFKGEMEFSEAIANMQEMAIQWIERLAQMAQVAIEKGAEMLINLIEGFSNNLPMFLDTVVGLVESFVGILTENLPRIAEAGVQFITSIVEGIVSALPMIVEVVTTLVENYVNMITTLLPMVLEAGVQLLTGLIDGIIQNLPMLLEAATSIIEMLVNTITTLLPMILKIGAKLIHTLLEAIAAALPQIVEGGTMIIEMLVSTIIELLPMLIDVAIQLVTTLVEALTEALPLILNAGIEILMALIDGIIQLLPALIEAALQIITTLLEALIEAVPILIEAAVQILTTLVEAIIELLPMLIEAALQILLALVDGIIEALPMLIEAALQIIQTLVEGIIELLPALIEAAIKIILALVDGLIQALPELLEAAVRIIDALVEGIIELLPVIIEAAIEIILAIIDGLMQAEDQLIEAGGQLIQSLISSIMEEMPSLSELGGKVLGWIVDGIKEGFTDMYESGADLVGQFADGIASAKDQAVEKVKEVAGNIRDYMPFSPAKIGPLSTIDQMDFGGPISSSITNGLSATGAAANSLVNGIQNKMTVGFSNMQSVVSSSINAIINVISNGFSNGVSAVTSAISSISNAISSGFSSATSFVSSAMSNIGSAISSGMSNALSTVSSVLSSIGSAFSSAWSGITSAVSSAISSLVSTIASGIQSAQSTAASVLSSILSTFTSTFSNILSAVTSAISNIVSSIASGMSSAQSTAMSTLQSILSTFTSTFSNILSAVGSAMSSVVSAVASGMSNLVSRVRTGVSNALSTVRGFIGSFTTMGRNLIQGLVRGIQNKIGSAISAVRNAGERVKSVFKRVTNIGSPSKDFKKYGGWLMIGAKLGVDGEGKGLIKSTESVAVKMSKAFENALDIDPAKALADNLSKRGNAFDKYFDFVASEGDFMNDWLTQIPKDMKGIVAQAGYDLTKSLGMDAGNGALLDRLTAGMDEDRYGTMQSNAMQDALTKAFQREESGNSGGGTTTVAAESKSDDVTYHFEIPVIAEGREIARASAKYTKAEIEKIEKQQRRARGEY